MTPQLPIYHLLFVWHISKLSGLKNLYLGPQYDQSELSPRWSCCSPEISGPENDRSCGSGRALVLRHRSSQPWCKQSAVVLLLLDAKLYVCGNFSRNKKTVLCTEEHFSFAESHTTLHRLRANFNAPLSLQQTKFTPAKSGKFKETEHTDSSHFSWTR